MQVDIYITKGVVCGVCGKPSVQKHPDYIREFAEPPCSHQVPGGGFFAGIELISIENDRSMPWHELRRRNNSRWQWRRIGWPDGRKSP